MAFQQGLSGLNTSAKTIDVISNNIANASTVGFKTAGAHFGDMFAASLQGAGASTIGIGAQLGSVAQQFTQGNVTSTNNPLDVAINGNGFFTLNKGGEIRYSRNGQFHIDKEGFVINDDGGRLQGRIAASDGTIRPNTPEDIQISAALAKLEPVETGTSTGGSISGIVASLNLDSRTPLPVAPATTKWTVPTQAEPQITPTSYDYSTALTTFDSLGNPHNLTLYFVKTSTAGQWEMYGSMDGTLGDTPAGPSTPDVPSLTKPVFLTFNTTGALTSVSTLPGPPVPPLLEFQATIDLDRVATNLGKVNNANPVLGGGAVKISLEGTTQFGSSFSTNRLVQDGFSSGDLAGISVSPDGIIQGRYSNGQTKNVAQVVLASFTNPNGLQSVGQNYWIQTSASGAPTSDAPGAGLLGVLQSSSVEDSNVDLTAELVSMITAQRNYQANAQSIKTQDQIMQTLVNLR